MMPRRSFLASLCTTLFAPFACAARTSAEGPTAPGITGLEPDPATITPVSRTDEEWKKLLLPESYRILRQSGTERSFTGPWWDNHEKGQYFCAGCGLHLFDSSDKFDSGTGWPSYTQPVKSDRLKLLTDSTLGMVRVEERCARCDGHLGHVFDDGPRPTGERHCINGWALVFIKSA
jgi:peptide-methionine (R)-S-oxide reductase